MPKRGNWGDWAVIDLPPTEIKKVSCYACSFYCEEDGSCLKTPIIPRENDNKSAWKKCKHFELDSKYMTNSFIETVKRVKGNDFFLSENKESEHVKSNVDDNREQETLLFCDYEIGAWIKSDTFGTGKLVDVYPGKVVIDFQGKQRKFLYPQAFDECLLFLVHEPIKEETEATSVSNIILQKERFEYEDEIGVLAETKVDAVQGEQASEEENNKEYSSDLKRTVEETMSKNDEKQIIAAHLHLENQNTEITNMESNVTVKNEGEECGHRNRMSIFGRGIRWIKSLFGKKK